MQSLDTIWKYIEGSCHSIMADMLDCNIRVSDFEFQSCYYIIFWTNTLGKVINLLIPAAIV